MAQTEEMLKRIEAIKDVTGIVVVNPKGIPIRTTLDHLKSVCYSRLLRGITTLANTMVRNIDPQNDLTVFCISTKKHEIMVAPENNHLLIVIQNPRE